MSDEYPGNYGKRFAALPTWIEPQRIDTLLDEGWEIVGFTSTPPDVRFAGLYVLLVNLRKQVES